MDEVSWMCTCPCELRGSSFIGPYRAIYTCELLQIATRHNLNSDLWLTPRPLL